MILIGSVILGLVVTVLWNWTGNYLAWSLFHYALPVMNCWEGICLAFVLITVCWLIYFFVTYSDRNDKLL